MIKWFKKHCKKLIIATSILTACVGGAFGISKSYAYTQNQNGELIGNNIINNTTVTNIVMNSRYTNLDGNYNFSIHDNFFYEVEFNNYQGSDSAEILLEFNNFTPTYFIDKKISIGVLIESNNFSIGNYQTSYNSYVALRRNNTTIDYQSTIIANSSTLNSFNGSNKKCYFVPFDTMNWNSYPNSHFILSLRINNNSNNTVNGKLRFTYFMFENSTISEVTINSNNQIFYPASSIAELQENYDLLQQQYNDYVANHSYTNTQYNDLVSQNSSLQQQLNTLQTQYNLYVATHSYTDSEYNDLNERYGIIINRYVDLQEDYELLQSQYDRLRETYETLQNVTNYGIFGYLTGYSYGDILTGGIEFSGNYNNTIYRILPPNYETTHDFQWKFEELIQEGLLEVGGVLRLDKLTERTDYNSNVNYDCVISFNHLPTSSFYLYFENTNGQYVTINDYNSRTINLTTNSIENSFSSKTLYDIDINFGNEIQRIIIMPQFSSSNIYYKTIGAISDTISYNNGYNEGIKRFNEKVDEYEEYIGSLRNTIQQERATIQALTDRNQTLEDLLQDDNSLYSMIISIADTPIAIFKQIFNFDVLGINISGIVTTIISLLIIIWLIKKLI